MVYFCDTLVVPNQPKTPKRGFRIPTDLYLAAQAKAASENRTLTEVVREALSLYVTKDSASTEIKGTILEVDAQGAAPSVRHGN